MFILLVAYLLLRDSHGNGDRSLSSDVHCVLTLILCASYSDLDVILLLNLIS